jgi:hypothetical protein
MKVVDIVPKQIYVKMEFSDVECQDILNFFEKAIPLYAKVHFDSPIDDSLSVADNFRSELKSIVKTIKEETDRDGS